MRLAHQPFMLMMYTKYHCIPTKTEGGVRSSNYLPYLTIVHNVARIKPKFNADNTLKCLGVYAPKIHLALLPFILMMYTKYHCNPSKTKGGVCSTNCICYLWTDRRPDRTPPWPTDRVISVYPPKTL